MSEVYVGLRMNCCSEMFMTHDKTVLKIMLK